MNTITSVWDRWISPALSMRKSALAVAALTASCLNAAADLRVASPFGNGMVLQQDRRVPVWGTAATGATVLVTYGTGAVSCATDAGGRWRTAIPTPPARPGQQPGTLTVTERVPSGAESSVTFSNVLVGEVWICSGQSNMQWPVSAAGNASAEIAAAVYPSIREFTVPRTTAAVPQPWCDGRWTVCSTQTVAMLSAIGYFFARHLHRELGIPVGMLNTSWSGSPIEPWIALDVLRSTDAARERVAAFEKRLAEYEADPARFDVTRADAQRRQDEAVAQWTARQFAEDVGERERWCTGAAGSGVWRETPMPMPPNAPFLSNYVGFVWCKTEIEIPLTWVECDLALSLGPVDEADVTYVNGKIVGETRDTRKWQMPRYYTVPAAAVTNDRLIIVVRVMNQVGTVGVFGDARNFKLMPIAPLPNDQPISLAGTWRYARGSPIVLANKPSVTVPPIPGSSWDVSTIYNAMIAPLAPYAARGALWYQGESNAGQPAQYAELLPAMIRCWRSAWERPDDFSFLIVQLANFMARQRAPVEPQSWAGLRDAQRQTLAVPRTGLAVAIDVGDAADIHPRNKQEVGRRLALWALGTTYGRRDLVYSGPLYRSLAVTNGRAAVSFDHTGSGLVARGTPLSGFAVAGTNRVFHAAEAAITGQTVVVTSAAVPQPAAVRYGWANNPVGNLYNREGLPASPFRTDDWLPSTLSAAPETVSEPAP